MTETAKQFRDRTIHDTLVSARALIADEDSWCQEYEDGDGRICAVHAICRAYGASRHDGGPAQSFIQSLIGGTYLGRFNDHHSHAEVLALFDRAIAESAAA